MPEISQIVFTHGNLEKVYTLASNPGTIGILRVHLFVKDESWKTRFHGMLSFKMTAMSQEGENWLQSVGDNVSFSLSPFDKQPIIIISGLISLAIDTNEQIGHYVLNVKLEGLDLNEGEQLNITLQPSISVIADITELQKRKGLLP